MPKLTDKPAGTVLNLSDLIHIVDVSDITSSPFGTSKSYTLAQLKTIVDSDNQDLTNVLTAGATMSNGQTISALNGPAVFDPRFLGVNEQLSLYTATHTALGVGTGSFLDLTTATGIQFGHKQAFFSMVDLGATQSIFMGSTANFFVDNCAKISLTNDGAILEFILGGFTKVGSVDIRDNDSGSATTLNLPNFPITMSSQDTRTEAGVINSTANGGVGTIVKTSNTGYANQWGFNTGLTGELIVNHTPNAADFVATFQAKTGTIAYLSDVQASDSLTEILANGNTTADGQTFQSLNGDVQLDLRQGVNNTYVLSNDNGVFAKSWFFGDNTTTQWGFGANYLGVASSNSISIESLEGASAYLSFSNQKVGVFNVSFLAADTNGFITFDNTIARTTTTATPNHGIVFNNSGPVTFNAGVDSSIALGYAGTVKTNNTAYFNQMAFSTGSFELTLINAAITVSDKAQTFQNKTGIIALLSDITAHDGDGIYAGSGLLTGSTTVTMGTNDLLFVTTGDAQILSIDGTNDRIGIGVLAPSEKLDVLGNVKIVGQAYSNIAATLTPGGTTQTIDWNDGNGAVLDLASATGNVTLTLSNPKAGATYTIKVIQDATTPRDLVYPAAVKWANGIIPVISVGATEVDLIVLSFDGANYLSAMNQNFS